MKKYTGEELYKLKQKLGLSDYKLAERLGLSRAVVHGRIFNYKVKNGLDVDDSASTVVSEANGELRIKSTSRIRTLEQLIKAFDIDTERWKVKSFTAEKWDSATDQTEKFLIKAAFEEIKPEQRPVRPIELVVTPVKTSKQLPQKKLQKTLGLFDIHFGFSRDLRTGELIPFHDRKALSVSLELARTSQPDVIVFGGDFLDMSEWSDKFLIQPGFYFTTQNALLECDWWIGQFMLACPDAKIVVMNGNHEARLDILVSKRLVAFQPLASVKDAMPLVSVDTLLGLSKNGIEYIKEYPDGRYKVCDDTIIEHGSVARAKAGMTAAAVAEQRSLNVIFGHKHTLERASRNIETASGKFVVTAACSGCLCRIDGVVPGSNRDVQWQNGITEIVHDEKKTHAINQILIIDGVCCYDGKLLSYDSEVIQQAAVSAHLPAHQSGLAPAT